MRRTIRFKLWQLMLLIVIAGLACAVCEPYYSGWNRHQRLLNYWREKGAFIAESSITPGRFDAARYRTTAEIAGTGLCSKKEASALLADPYIVGLSIGLGTRLADHMPTTNIKAPLRNLAISWSPVSVDEFLDIATDCNLEQGWLLFNEPAIQSPTKAPSQIPRRLHTLSLAWSHVSVDELARFGQCFSIRNLDLTCVPISDQQLAFLGKLPLEELVLSSTQVSGDGLALLAQPHALRRLSLSRASCADSDDYADAFQYRNFHDPPATSTGARTLQHLPGFIHLDTLDLSYSTLDLSEWKYVAQLGKLKWLCLTQTSVGNSEIATLGCLDSIASLGLAGTQIDDGVLRTLASCANLRVLDIRDTQVTMVGIEELLNSLKLDVLITSWSPNDAYHFIYEADRVGVGVLSFQEVFDSSSEAVPWRQAANGVEIDTEGEYGEEYPFRTCVAASTLLERPPWTPIRVTV